MPNPNITPATLESYPFHNITHSADLLALRHAWIAVQPPAGFRFANARMAESKVNWSISDFRLREGCKGPETNLALHIGRDAATSVP